MILQVPNVVEIRGGWKLYIVTGATLKKTFVKQKMLHDLPSGVTLWNKCF
jgi:hypothetical protein